MNAITSLESMGLSLSLSENGKLAVEGLKRLSHEEREYALSLAQAHKSAIVATLRRQLTQPDPAALAHAQRMQVEGAHVELGLYCSLTGGPVSHPFSHFIADAWG